MKKWLCKDCDYIYDETEGDDMNGITPGTSYDNLPYDWVCPDCGNSKRGFTVKEYDAATDEWRREIWR